MKQLTNKDEILHLKREIYRLRRHLVENIISTDISPFLMNVCACIVVIFISNQLIRYGGDMAVGAFGMTYNMAMIFVMFIIGLDQGMQPITGYNYGSQQTDRLMHILKLAIFAATGIMVTGWLIAHLAPYYCARMFAKDPELIRQAIKAIQIDMMMYPVVGFQMVVTSFFQCIGKVKISIFLSLSRQLLFLIPLLVILPHFFNLNGVWASLPSSDFLTSLVAAIIMMAYMRRLEKQSVSNQNLNS